MKNLQFTTINKIILFVVMVIPIYAYATVPDNQQSEYNHPLRVCFYLPFGTVVSVESFDPWSVVLDKDAVAEEVYSSGAAVPGIAENKSIFSKISQLTATISGGSPVPFTLLNNHCTEIIINRNAETTIKFEDLKVVISNEEPAESDKSVAHISPAVLKGTDNLEFFMLPEQKNRTQMYTSLQFGQRTTLQFQTKFNCYHCSDSQDDDNEHQIKNKIADDKTTISFSATGKTYFLPKSFYRNNKAAFYPVAADTFLAVTPTKACFLKDNPESTEDDSEHLIVTEIPVFEDCAAMLTAGVDGYCSGVCSISMCDSICSRNIYFYDQKKVNIEKINLSKMMPNLAMWPDDYKGAQTKKKMQTRAAGKQQNQPQQAASSIEQEFFAPVEQQEVLASILRGQKQQRFYIRIRSKGNAGGEDRSDMSEAAQQDQECSIQSTDKYVRSQLYKQRLRSRKQNA